MSDPATASATDRISVCRRLRELATDDPDRPAVTFDGTTRTRAQLADTTNRLARLFAAKGVADGDLVTICLKNGHPQIESALAALKIGAIPQPLTPTLPPRELETIVDLANPTLVIANAELEHVNRPMLSPPWAIDDFDASPLPDVVAPAWKAATSGGSTGRPKVIVSGAPAVVDTTAPSVFGLRRDGVVLVPGPLSHNAPFGLAMMALFHGVHVVLMPRFDAETSLALIERHDVEVVFFVPTMMSRIWRLGPEVRDRYDLSSLKIVFHSAAPCPQWLKRERIDWLGAERIFESYGSTEQQATTLITGPEWLEHVGSVGRTVSGEIKILGADGDELPAGEEGEIFMRPPDGVQTYRYVGAEAVVRDGWETLGDLGWLDADGYLYLSDRRSDLILCGGANIYPAEVEAAIEAHADVISSAVVGLPDEDLGQRVHAIVQAEPALTEESLRAHLQERLPPYKQPRSIEFVAEPLRDDAGKVRRSALRDARSP